MKERQMQELGEKEKERASLGLDFGVKLLARMRQRMPTTYILAAGCRRRMTWYVPLDMPMLLMLDIHTLARCNVALCSAAAFLMLYLLLFHSRGHMFISVGHAYATADRKMVVASFILLSDSRLYNFYQ